jgi:replicative DNA helicase
MSAQPIEPGFEEGWDVKPKLVKPAPRPKNRRDRAQLEAYGVGDRMGKLVERLEIRSEYPDVSLSATGLVQLDKIANLTARQLIVLAGLPGAGKTALAAQLAGAITAGEGLPALYCVAEGDADDFLLRMAAAHAQIPFSRVKKAPTPKDVLDVRKALAQWADQGLLICECPGATPEEIYQLAVRVIEKRGRLGGVFADNLAGMRPSDERLRQDNLHVWYGSMIQEFNAMKLGYASGGLDTLILVMHHLTTPAGQEGKLPGASHLAGSKVIERFADTVMLLHEIPESMRADAIVNGGVAAHTHKLVMAKIRNDAKCVLPLNFIGRELRFVDPAGASPEAYDMPAPPSDRSLELRARLAAIDD